MDSIHDIVALYRDDQRTAQIINALEQEGQTARLQITGTSGAQDSFAIAGVFLAKPGHHLIIAIDKDDADDIQNNLANLLPDKTIHFFPNSFKRNVCKVVDPNYFEELNNDKVLQRTESINKLTTPGAIAEIVVTYPEALFEKVVSPIALNKERWIIKKGEQVNIDALTEFLIDYGFLRVDFVYKPGQFSVRGGIVDIYSYGNEYPYRVEFFDEEVESIRTFDPNSQLSQQNISQVSLVPNVNTKFKQHEKTSLLNVLPQNTTTWIKDFEGIIDKLVYCFDNAEKYAQNFNLLEDDQLREILKDRAFIRPGEVLTDLESRAIVFIGTAATQFKVTNQIQYNSNPQPSFKKNFSALIRNFHENTNNRIENFIFTDQPKQIERFYSIFRDLNEKVKFTPILKDISQGFIDLHHNIACYTDHQIFERYHKRVRKFGFSRDTAINMRLLRELQPGDYVTHIDYGVGRFSGLEKLNINGVIQEAVRLVYKNNDLLYVGINSLHKIAKFVGKDGTPPTLNKIGSDAWANLKRTTKRKIKDIAEELIKLYALRKSSDGFAFQPDTYLQTELEASFMYEDTPDQYKATHDVKLDMEKTYPMDRLICGDVGFGKTEVAIRAAFKAVADGKQVAILVPTTILATQHFKTFRDRLSEFGATVDYINRFRSTKEKKQIFENLKSGKIDIIIGTHGLLGKEVAFKDLGLLIIDEEQKFGVAAKEKLRSLKVNVDTLTLTATPIPRTLQFSLMAARDLSVIRTPPPNRQPINTEVRTFNDELIKDAIYFETNRGGQVFFVHNRVQTLPTMVESIRQLCPDVSVAMAHGQLKDDELEQVLLDFIDNKFDVLVSTNIIETGLDITNANTIIINNAHQFGISDLHQLRGRVGRSNRQAYCYLFCPPLSVLPTDTRKRLKTLEEFSDLGSGFDIAMRDLDIRGAGNLLGGEQSGFIADIGYETYQKILEEAVHELKTNEFRSVFEAELGSEKLNFVQDVTIDTDTEMHIPDSYVYNVQERLSLYTQLDEIGNEEGIGKFKEMLEDRFGRLPYQVEELFEGLRLRWVAKQLGFERIILKGKKMNCYFVSNPQSAFYESDLFKKMLQFVNTKGKPQQLSFKQSPKSFIMVKENVDNVKSGKQTLEIILMEILK